MMGSFCSALVKAGAGENRATKRFEELATSENRFERVEADVTLLKWMVGSNLAMTAAVVGKLFSGGS